jgi:hypothetical protein
MHIIEISQLQWLDGRKRQGERISLPTLPWLARRLDPFWDLDAAAFRRQLDERRRITEQTPEQTDA